MNAHIAKCGTCQPALEVGALINVRQSKPVPDSQLIAREFGRRHKSVLKSIDDLIEDSTTSRPEFKPRDYTAERGKKRRLIELAERGPFIALPFIGGNNSRAVQVRVGDAFLTSHARMAERDLGEWASSRKEVLSSLEMASAKLLSEDSEERSQWMNKYA